MEINPFIGLLLVIAGGIAILNLESIIKIFKKKSYKDNTHFDDDDHYFV